MDRTTRKIRRAAFQRGVNVGMTGDPSSLRAYRQKLESSDPFLAGWSSVGQEMQRALNRQSKML